MTSTLTHRPPADVTRRPLSAIYVWFGVGVALLAAEWTLILRWVTGPNFEEIPVGPDQPPHWMRVVLDVGQLAAVVVAAVIVWLLLLRPLLRDRQLTLNGTFVIAGFFAAPFDGIAGYGQQWLNYNSYLFNRGSVLSAFPGVQSPQGPGYGQSWPFFALPAYIILVPALGAFGCLVMRRARRQWPNLRAPGLIGVCLLAMAAIETSIEALLLAPLGFYTLTGSQGPLINSSHYYGMPIPEIVHGAMFFTVPAVVKYFVNDNGETLPEQGSAVIPGTVRRAGMRAVAVIGAIHLGFLTVYHVPVTLINMNSREFADDVKQRSYFLGNACGEAIDIACPGPKTPQLRHGAGHFDWDGNFVPPAR